jgi:hypothetical protein
VVFGGKAHEHTEELFQPPVTVFQKSQGRPEGGQARLARIQRHVRRFLLICTPSWNTIEVGPPLTAVKAPERRPAMLAAT